MLRSLRGFISKREEATQKMDETPRRRAKPSRMTAAAAVSDADSEEELDDLLHELGIPDSGSKKQKEQQRQQLLQHLSTPPPSKARRDAVGAVEVIELITPPRTNDASSRALSDSGDEVCRSPLGRENTQRSDSSRRVSIVDLTSTPSPVGSRDRRATSSEPTSVMDLNDSSSISPLPSPSVTSPPLSSRHGVEVADCDEPIECLGSSSEDEDGGRTVHQDASSDVDTGVTSSSGASAELSPLPDSLNFMLSSLDSTRVRRVPAVLSTPQKSPRRRKRPNTAVTNAALQTAQLSSTMTTPPRTAQPRSTPKSPGGHTPGASNVSSSAVFAVVRMESSLAESETGRAIKEALHTHSYNGKPIPYEIAANFECRYARVVTWGRRSGFGGSSHTNPSVMCACCIYFEAPEFLKLLLDNGYGGIVEMTQYLIKFLINDHHGVALETTLPADGKQVFLVVEGMDQALVQYKKASKKKAKKQRTDAAPSVDGEHGANEAPSITFSDLNEMAFQLFMDAGVHTKFTCDQEASTEYLAMVTREIVLAAGRKSSQEEFLESVPRLHSFRVTAEGGTVNAYANAWLRMLQTVPGVSEDKAQGLLDHFPTFDSLLRVYRDPTLTQSDKEDFLCDKLHDSRIERALSKRIYSIFSATDPAANI